jgi:aminopeptidase N
LQAAENSIRIYNKYFGKYPYKNYSVVQTHFSAGMEYPNLVFIAESYFSEGKTLTSLESVIAHETAHQWWYGVVGNDEIDEAWLDESFATYSKRIYFEMLYGNKTGEDFYKKNILDKYKSKRRNINGKEIILKPLPEFESWADYDPLAYEKGAVMLDTIRSEVGDEKFFEIMRTYYSKNKFKNVKTQDFIDAVESITEKNWQVFFDKWLLDKKTLE